MWEKNGTMMNHKVYFKDAWRWNHLFDGLLHKTRHKTDTINFIFLTTVLLWYSTWFALIFFWVTLLARTKIININIPMSRHNPGNILSIYEDQLTKICTWNIFPFSNRAFAEFVLFVRLVDSPFKTLPIA